MIVAREQVILKHLIKSIEYDFVENDNAAIVYLFIRKFKDRNIND